MLSAAHARASGGIPVADYRGLTAAQGAQVMSIAGDTWKFYPADIDPATNLPMDNLTFAGGSATPTEYGKLHLRGQHRGVPIGRGLGQGSRVDQ